MVRRTRSSLSCCIALCILVCFLLLQLYLHYSWTTEATRRKTRSSVHTRTMHGLTALGQRFQLDKKDITILSGAVHYFRVVPEYWEDRLRKLKAVGLNTVETYVAWNLHEPSPGVFNFDGIADIRQYIKLAQQLGLHVIVRPGPYICAEWEFGGLPSWLLRNRELEIRSMSKPYLQAVDRYLGHLLHLLSPLQYKNGGPIIAFQIENEYGNYGDSAEYMKHLHDIFIQNGISELLFTSDGLRGIKKRLLPEVLQTVNFQFKPEEQLKSLKELQPNKPMMVMEYWPGWFDHWGEKHQVMDGRRMVDTVRTILTSGASINFYMFHGGTNFGFMNGANHQPEKDYQPTITSYDYDAPISECGDITEKYRKLHKLLQELKFTTSNELVLPREIKRGAYGIVKMTKTLSLEKMAALLKKAIDNDDVMSMEDLPINNRAGQSYGYTLYRTEIAGTAKQVFINDLRDYGQVFVDQVAKGVIKWPKYKGQIDITSSSKGSAKRVLDILVENCGRVNYGKHILDQRKGILGNVEVDKQKQKRWKMFPFDFDSKFLKALLDCSNNWQDVSKATTYAPAMFKGLFSINEKPKDSFLDMKGWSKGVVFINGHNIGRYWDVGPQKTLYVPAPWLQQGENTVMIFEQHSSGPHVELVKEHLLGPREEHSPST